MSSIEADAAKTIKIRAVTFLRSWVEIFYTDLDDTTLNRIKTFATDNAEEVPDLANSILKEIENKVRIIE